MPLPIRDGNQSLTTLSTLIVNSAHVPAHTVVSLGSQAITDIAQAVSGVELGPNTLNALENITVTLGQVTITGGLTDTQLRASPVTVGGTVTANGIQLQVEDALFGSDQLIGALNSGLLLTANVPIAGTVTANVASSSNIGIGFRDIGGNLINVDNIGNGVPSIIYDNVGNSAVMGDASGQASAAVAIGHNSGGQFNIVGENSPLPIAGTVTANVIGTYQDENQFEIFDRGIGLAYSATLTDDGLPYVVTESKPLPVRLWNSTVTVGNSVTISSLPAISGTVTANTAYSTSVTGTAKGGTVTAMPVALVNSGVFGGNILDYNGTNTSLNVSIKRVGQNSLEAVDSTLPVSGTVTVGNSVTIGSLPAISGTVTANLSSTNLNSVTIGVRGTVTANTNLLYPPNNIGDSAPSAIPIGFNDNQIDGAFRIVSNTDWPLPVALQLNTSYQDGVNASNPMPISGTVTADINRLIGGAENFISIAGESSGGAGVMVGFRNSAGETSIVGVTQESGAGPLPISGTVTVGTISNLNLNDGGDNLAVGLKAIGGIDPAEWLKVEGGNVPISGTVTANVDGVVSINPPYIADATTDELFGGSHPFPISGTVTANLSNVVTADLFNAAQSVRVMGAGNDGVILQGVDAVLNSANIFEGGGIPVFPREQSGNFPISGTVTANVFGYDPYNGVYPQIPVHPAIEGFSSNDEAIPVIIGTDLGAINSISNRLPISGTVTAAAPNGSLTTRFGTPTTANVSFATAAVTKSDRKYLLIQNVTTGSNVITVGIGFTPTTTQGIQLTAGAGITFESSFIPTGAVYVLSSVTASNFTILEA